MRLLAMFDFFQDVMNHFIAFLRFELLLHAAERNAHHVAMVHFRAGVFLAQLEPNLVHEIDIFGP